MEAIDDARNVVPGAALVRIARATLYVARCVVTLAHEIRMTTPSAPDGGASGRRIRRLPIDVVNRVAAGEVRRNASARARAKLIGFLKPNAPVSRTFFDLRRED